MKQPKKAFHIQTQKVVFSKGPIHLVDCMVKMPSGNKLSRQIIEHPGAVVILPKVDKKHFLLIRQFRFAVRSWIWEWPAGGIESGETLKNAANRELMEEVGHRASKLTKLVSFYPTPGISSEIMHLFLAEGLSPQSIEGDEDEEIRVKAFSLREIGKMIKEGRIKDAKTIVGYFYLRNL